MDHIATIASLITDDPDVFLEDNWIQKAVDPDKAGMFDGISLSAIKKEQAALKRKNVSRRKRGEKVPQSDRTRMSQLTFAIRAKGKGGLTGDE